MEIGEKIMKRIPFLIGVVAILMVSSMRSFAQDGHPGLEVYGTYSLLRADIDAFNNESLQGWGAGVQWNPFRVVGLAAEVTGNYGSTNVLSRTVPGSTTKVGTNVYMYLVCPRASWRTRPFTLFAHSLFGFATLDANEATNCVVCTSITNNKFAMALGGGIDINLTKGLAIRAGQFDYVPI